VRHTIKGERFEFNYGVDGVTGLFCDCFLQPADEQDTYLFMINNTGVFLEQEARSILPPKVVALVEQYARRLGVQINVVTIGIQHIGADGVIDLAQSLGLPVNSREVFQNLD
jgi:hypothetical protein